MENLPNISTPTGGGGHPLNVCSPERINQQRPQSAILSSMRGDFRDSSVHEKISQFNTLALQGKQLERKTADAALTRALLGREEAENEMRRYRDEARALRKVVEEGKEREKRVGERMEQVMEQYIRFKEMHQHTQTLWEKEIRRLRKDHFKAQSGGVKHAEELKLARESLKAAEASLAKEKERGRAREQEAFAARYQIVGVQEQLDQALEKIKLVEQERDAFKTLAKNEEVARIAAEGCIPLPPPENAQDEFASPKKTRTSLSTADVVSSAATEEEMEELARQLEWEQHRARRAQDLVDFLTAECELRCCARAKSQRRRSSISPRRMRPRNIEVVDPSDLAILRGKATSLDDDVVSDKANHATPALLEQTPALKQRREKRRSTIFCPKEGIFRTISQDEADAMQRIEEDGSAERPAAVDPNADTVEYARTPSIEPPAFALLAQERMSLLSLLEAPHQNPRESDINHLPAIPTMRAVPDESCVRASPSEEQDEGEIEGEIEGEREGGLASGHSSRHTTPEDVGTSRPHTSAAFYTVTTTTTVPLRDHKKTRQANHPYSRSGSNGSSDHATFDATNPAMTPTMTREQALAQIRERRGRARSAAQGAATPRRQMIQGVERRDLSAPTGRIPAKARSG